MASITRKNLEAKEYCSKIDKKSIPMRVENSLKNTFLLGGKTANIARNVYKIKQNDCQ